MKARSTFDGKTVEEIEASGESMLDYIARRIEESGGVVTLTDRAADAQIIRRVVLKGVRITEVTIGDLWEGCDDVKVEYIRMPVAKPIDVECPRCGADPGVYCDPDGAPESAFLIHVERHYPMFGSGPCSTCDDPMVKARRKKAR